MHTKSPLNSRGARKYVNTPISWDTLPSMQSVKLYAFFFDNYTKVRLYVGYSFVFGYKVGLKFKLIGFLYGFVWVLWCFLNHILRACSIQIHLYKLVVNARDSAYTVRMMRMKVKPYNKMYADAKSYRNLFSDSSEQILMKL